MKIITNCTDSNAKTVLRTSLKIFCQYTPLRELEVINIMYDKSRDCPICFKQRGFIYLASDYPYWSQTAYQLFHELCHCAIRNHIEQRFLWFEESICELSSYFFLIKLKNFWIKNNINFQDDKGKTYAYNFETYAYNDMKKAFPFQVNQTLNDNLSQHILHLMECDQYIRKLNANIALILMPIFSQYTDLWKAITYLGGSKTHDNFQSFLLDWRYQSPVEHRPSIDKVLSLFGVYETVNG